VQTITPAVVTQAAVKRLPRAALLGLCIAYVFAGFIGRGGWKSADMTALGFMAELATGHSNWWHPTLLGMASEYDALLPYWLGAWMIQLSPGADWNLWLVRLPFVVLLGLAMASTWYGTYYLAKSPQAQPVVFAFGGQAQPNDYARTVADGALLAFIACLGLAQLGHETTPALAQLGFMGLFFYGVCALPFHPRRAGSASVLGLAGLTLSGAPTLACLIGLGCAAITSYSGHTGKSSSIQIRNWRDSLTLLMACLYSAAMATALHLWHWNITPPQALWVDWNGYLQLLVWFLWPAWPLAGWAVFRWRKHSGSRHIALPLWIVVATLCATLMMGSSDRTLLLALPAIASLAAFALPTLKRQMASLVDWFTLLFFSACGLTIWVVWLAMHTGLPPQPAANVMRIAPGFVPQFSLLELLFALAATGFWLALVRWRTRRQRAALWKSLALPAGGAVWCWMLLSTLWLPLLDYTQGYANIVRDVSKAIDKPGCIEVRGLETGPIAALLWAGRFTLVPGSSLTACTWLLSGANADGTLPATVDTANWTPKASINHPTDAGDVMWLSQRR
jgi:hypothetical protein